MISLTKKLSHLALPALLVSLLCSLFFAFAAPAPTLAAQNNLCSEPTVPNEVKIASGCQPDDAPPPSLINVVVSILNGVISVLGFVSVGFVIYGGILYLSSGGDAQKTLRGRNAIVYALIGLVIAALSFSIVNFVIVGIIHGDVSNSAESSQDANNSQSK